MTPRERLVGLVKEAGADAVGFAEALPVDEEEWKRFEAWLDAGFHAGMGYMENHKELRRDPGKLMPGARTVVSMAFNYRQPNPIRGVATYALGQDYHKVLRRRLKSVVKSMKTEFGGEWRICIDSAPVLERYWAVKCGIGYRNEVNGNIIVPGIGSMVFLAELITTLKLIEGEEKPLAPAVWEKSGLPNINVCRSGALKPGGLIDSRRCINYLTIEHRGELSVEQKEIVGDHFFGCDVCLRLSPENKTPCPPIMDEFKPMPGLDGFIRGEENDFDINISPLKRKFL